MKINIYGFKAIYFHEMDRFRRTLGQSLLSPVISTSLYFIVFGSVIGGYVQKIDGIRMNIKLNKDLYPFYPPSIHFKQSMIKPIICSYF